MKRRPRGSWIVNVCSGGAFWPDTSLSLSVTLPRARPASEAEVIRGAPLLGAGVGDGFGPGGVVVGPPPPAAGVVQFETEKAEDRTAVLSPF